MTARALPSDEAIYAEYVRQLPGGRGAYARTARILGCSDELVRKVKARHEAKRPLPYLQIVPKVENSAEPTAETEHSLAYVPAPGEEAYQEECRRLARTYAELSAHRAEISAAHPQLILSEHQQIMSLPLPTVRVCQHSPFNTLRPYDIVGNRRRCCRLLLGGFVLAWVCLALTHETPLAWLWVVVMLACGFGAAEMNGRLYGR